MRVTVPRLPTSPSMVTRVFSMKNLHVDRSLCGLRKEALICCNMTWPRSEFLASAAASWFFSSFFAEPESVRWASLRRFWDGVKPASILAELLQLRESLVGGGAGEVSSKAVPNHQGDPCGGGESESRPTCPRPA